MMNFTDGEPKNLQKHSESEKILIDAFYVFCESRGVHIEFMELKYMTQTPSKFDLAVLYLVYRFFQNSPYASAFCMFFGIMPHDLIYLGQYLQKHIDYDKIKTLNKWTE